MTWIKDGKPYFLISCLLIRRGKLMSSRCKLTTALVLMAVVSTICFGQGSASTSRPASGSDSALMAKANAGNAEAEFKVGTKYELGSRVAKDPAQAAVWYRKAADKGYAPAQHSLGVLYETGTGVAADFTTATQWYRKEIGRAS